MAFLLLLLQLFVYQTGGGVINGISVSTIDLSEILGTAQKLADGDPRVKARLEEIDFYRGSVDVFHLR